MGRYLKDQKAINGAIFNLFDWCPTGEEADREIKDLRKRGFYARRVKVAEGYNIYRREKHK